MRYEVSCVSPRGTAPCRITHSPTPLVSTPPHSSPAAIQAALASVMLPWFMQLSPGTQPDRYWPGKKPQHTLGDGGGSEGDGNRSISPACRTQRSCLLRLRNNGCSAHERVSRCGRASREARIASAAATVGREGFGCFSCCYYLGSIILRQALKISGRRASYVDELST